MEYLHDRMSVSSSDDDSSDFKYGHLMDKKQYEFQKKLFIPHESFHEGGHSEQAISQNKRGPEEKASKTTSKPKFGVSVLKTPKSVIQKLQGLQEDKQCDIHVINKTRAFEDEAFEMVVRTSKTVKTGKKKSQSGREPTKRPVNIPANKSVLENIKKQRKVTRLLERQAILYGINCLDDGMFTQIIDNPDQPKDEDGNYEMGKKRSQEKAIIEKEEIYREFIQQPELNFDLQSSNKRNYNFFDKLVIKLDNPWKSMFDVIMVFASCYSTFSQAYYAAFGLPTSPIYLTLDYCVEFLFMLDFFFCFCQEYKDEETFSVVSDIKKTAKNYLRGSCFFDLLANIPFEFFFLSTENKISGQDGRLYKLFKLLRLPRLFTLLDIERIKQSLTDYYSKKLLEAVRSNNPSQEEVSYPILKVLMYVQVFKVCRLAMIIFTVSYFLGIVWHIYVCDVQNPVLRDKENPELGFKADFASAMLGVTDMEEYRKEPGWDKMVKVLYFAITTLSTIGFGDFTPVSTNERIWAAFILMVGVSIFSFIMGQFIDILINYKSLWEVGHHKDLSKWIALLSRFNNGNPLNKEMITKIEDFFNYYWENNPLSALNSEADVRFMTELPYYVQGQIYIDFLFKDFLYKYKSYFSAIQTLKNRGTRQECHDLKERNFLVEFVQRLEPRFYNKYDDQMIQDQYEEIFEVVFIQRGAVGVGYRLFNEIFYGLSIVTNQDKYTPPSGINDYACLHNKCSEFLYKPIDYVEAFAMRKENFDQIMKIPIAKKLKLTIAQNYKYEIQEPLYEHRDETAGKFKNRIDYVNIEAYDFKSENPQQDEGELIDIVDQREKGLFRKMEQLNKKSNELCHTFCAFAQRQDEQYDMILGKTPADEYQSVFTKKMFFTKSDKVQKENDD